MYAGGANEWPPLDETINKYMVHRIFSAIPHRQATSPFWVLEEEIPGDRRRSTVNAPGRGF
jgi:hypothetical protein